MQNNSYHDIRLAEDAKRSVLWRVLSSYLQKYIPPNSHVLDFGAGYCGFINGITARKKSAYDIWDGISAHSNANVQCIIGDQNSFEALEVIADASVDVIFASNIFEHFDVQELSQLVAKLKVKLTAQGRIIVVQPNYYLAFRHYFDDYTHKSIWSHESLPDFFKSKGFTVIAKEARFLPLTVKSRFPVHPLLIKAYLLSPFKPLAGQMMFVFELVGGDD